MSDQTAYLALLLDAPLQSWGYQSKFDRRTSFSQPTRSGVLGMICAAMGIDRDNVDALAEFGDLRMSAYTLSQNGRLVDFHTVGGGWDKKRHKRNIVPKADGGPGNTVVTRREYLQDSKFGVVIAGPRNQLERVAHALRNPRWGIWLGRKSCVPASPVEQGIFETTDSAIAHLRERVKVDSCTRVCEEVDSFENGNDTLMDVPLDFKKREFAPRRILVK